MSDDRFSPFVQLTSKKTVVYVRREAIVRVDGVNVTGLRTVHIVGSKPVEVDDTPENLRKLGIP